MNTVTQIVSDGFLESHPQIKNFCQQSVVDNKTVNYIQYSATDSELDTASGISFLYSQLAHVTPKIFETPFAPITYQEDVNILDANVHPDALTYVYRSITRQGMAQWISANNQDFPISSIEMKKHTVEIHEAGDAIVYSQDELRRSRHTGVPIDTQQIKSSIRAYQEFVQKVVYYGDKSKEMYGLYNNPNITRKVAAKKLGEMTGIELFHFANSLLIDLMNIGKNYYLPNTMLFYPQFFQRMSETFVNAYNTETALSYFKRNNYYTLLTGKAIDIKMRFTLTKEEMTAHANDERFTENMIVAYEKNSEYQGYLHPLPFGMRNGIQLDGLSFKMYHTWSLSGTEWRYPLSGIYGFVPE